MDTQVCEHRWRYFVHLESRAVRTKQCERCGRRRVVIPADNAAASERLSA